MALATLGVHVLSGYGGVPNSDYNGRCQKSVQVLAFMDQFPCGLCLFGARGKNRTRILGEVPCVQAYAGHIITRSQRFGLCYIRQENPNSVVRFQEMGLPQIRSTFLGSPSYGLNHIGVPSLGSYRISLKS